MKETLNIDFPKIIIENILLHTTIPINFSRKRYSYNRDLLAEDSYEAELTKIHIYESTIPWENAIKLDNVIRKSNRIPMVLSHHPRDNYIFMGGLCIRFALGSKLFIQRTIQIFPKV